MTVFALICWIIWVLRRIFGSDIGYWKRPSAFFLNNNRRCCFPRSLLKSLTICAMGRVIARVCSGFRGGFVCHAPTVTI